MHVLMLTYEVTQKGGNSIRAHNLARELSNLGHEVTLLASGAKASFGQHKTTIDGVKVVEVADIFPYRFRHDGMSLMQIINRIRFVKDNKFDIIHGFGHRFSASIPAIYGRYYHKIPYVADWSDLWGKGGIATLRGGIVGGIQGQIDTITEKLVYQNASALTVICQALYQRLINMGIKSDKILFLSAGGTYFSKNISQKDARMSMGLSLDKSYVVYVGNTAYDQKYLASCMVKLFHLNQDVQMLFAGANIPEFNSIINSRGFESRVHYLGFVPPGKIDKIIISGNVMLLPYLDTEINRNRFPNKLGDYLSFGRPTVTNATGDIIEMFRKYKIGFLASGDSGDFALKVNRLLTDAKMQKQYGDNALNLVKTEFSWKNRAKSLIKFYERLISEYKSR